MAAVIATLIKMRRLVQPGFIALLHLISSLAMADAPTVSSKLITRVFDEVYQIKTATDANAPKSSYGSCFVVDQAGLLVTNFHVVSSSLHEPDKYHLYLLDGDHTLPAEVVAFDAVNDLAIVHVEKTFSKTVRFAANLPDPGDKIYSIGWPEDLNKAVSEGNFNGIMTAGPYRKLQLSIPLNSGMSGGPTINESGEVIGVNVSLRVDSQSLAFAIPREQIRSLLKKSRSSFSRIDDRAAFDEEMRAQIEQVQEHLSNILLKGGTNLVNLGGWRVRKPAQMVKCWRSQESGPRDQTSLTTEHCYLPGSTPVRSDLETGTFHLKYQVIENHNLNRIQLANTVSRAVAGFGFNQLEFIEKLSTKIKCKQLDLNNAHKVPFRAHYCVNGYVPYAEAYNLEFEVVTLKDDADVLIMAGSFLGFSSHNSLEILRYLINSIRPEAA